MSVSADDSNESPQPGAARGAGTRQPGRARSIACGLACLIAPGTLSSAGAGVQLPEIRMHQRNGVPACVTTERLMAFVRSRNGGLEERYRDIAKWYRHHGEAWRVRWDFAFFQMALETNFLTYRRGNGERGDVHPAQNNFAGIGATGGGVPGDRFANVGTGVLAQIQHLVAYSGERMEQPVAPRTRAKQDDIVNVAKSLKRPVRFSDLARRWAADPRYAHSIAAIADSFYRDYCTARRQHGAAAEQIEPPPAPSSAAKARARQVARTIWHRNSGAPIGSQQAAAPAVPPPQQKRAVIAQSADKRAPQHVAQSGLLAGLQSVARNANAVLAEWPSAVPTPAPLVAPRPRLALRN